MVATLPRNIQLKLDQALNQWHQWHCDSPLPHRPEPKSLLGSGISNHSILVEAGGRYVIRIDGVETAGNGLSRSTEWRTLHEAHKAGLAPCPRYYNPELGVLVCDYLPPDQPGQVRQAETAGLLRRIHKLPGCHQRLNLREKINRYERQLEQREQALPPAMAAYRHRVILAVKELATNRDGTVLCHNDLLATNRIHSKGQLNAIDWEYCAMGSAWFDLAVIAIGDKLDIGREQELISAYLERDPEPEDTRRFLQNCTVYRYLELLWYLVNKADSPDIGDRLVDLEQALSRENY